MYRYNTHDNILRVCVYALRRRATRKSNARFLLLLVLRAVGGMMPEIGDGEMCRRCEGMKETYASKTKQNTVEKKEKKRNTTRKRPLAIYP